MEPIFMPVSKMIWDKKYRWNNESQYEFYKRIADSIFPDDKEKRDKLLKYLLEHKVCFGGRVLYALGTTRKNSTLSNCYVVPITDDSIRGIMKHAEEVALTLKSGGGVGMSYSIIRPKNCIIRSSGEKPSGPVSFMEIIDSVCKTISAGGNRRGAMLASLAIWHPDIMDFIKAKREKKLENMNISVEITDEFMKAVENDEDWNLEFPSITHPKYDEEWDGDLKKWKEKGYPTEVYETVKARELYEEIMKSTYDYAEPGVLFVDTLNRFDPVSTFADIRTTNPCLSGDVKIITFDEDNEIRVERIKDLVGRDRVKVLAYNLGKTLVIIEAINPRCTGKKELLKVKLSDGTEIKCTKNHEFITTKGAVKAEDLKPGTKIVCSELAESFDVEKIQKVKRCENCGDKIPNNQPEEVCFCSEDCAHAYMSKLKKMRPKLKTFVEVVSVEEAGEEEVYNITVPKYHNFGVVLNSGRVVFTYNCGEQPLPFIVDKKDPKNNMYFSCNLSMVNLAKFVKNPFEDSAEFDFKDFQDALDILVEATDRILDLNYYPLPEMERAAKRWRIIGIGITGLGDMLAMLKIPYDSERAREFVDRVMNKMAARVYYNSAILAKLYGASVSGDLIEKYLENEFVKRLCESEEGKKLNLKEIIKQNGLRNARLLTVAPTGTTSLLMNNVSSGIEPIFSLEYYRKINEKEECIEDYAWHLYKSKFGDEKIPEFFKTATEIDPLDHIKMQETVQRWIDGSISKTVNVDENYDYQKFKNLYFEAWKRGLKGCTTYRPNPIREPVLRKKDETKKETPNDIILKMLKNGIRPLIKRGLNSEEDAKRFIVYWKGIKVYINVVYDEEGSPLEVFSQIPFEAGIGIDGEFHPDLYMERLSYWTAISRLVSLLCRYGIPLEEIIEQLEKSTFNIVHLPGLLARVLKKFPLEEFIDDEEKEKITESTIVGKKCPSCGELKLIRYQGCEKCLNCGYSKCD